MNLFGGIMQSAIMQGALSEWRKLPPEELSCMKETLQQRGLSIQSLIQQGIAPFDVRLADVRASCQPGSETEGATPDITPPRSARTEIEHGAQESPYAVEGLALGGKVVFDSSVYREYECTPSEQFDGLVWCHRQTIENGPHGPFRSSYTILHSQDGAVSYVNRELDPAFFDPEEVDAEIKRLSVRFGRQPRLTRLTRSDYGGVIASWGDVAFEPLDTSGRDQLAMQKSPRKGILVDFIGNFQQSVKNSLPVYRTTGGPGFVWVASFDQYGRGKLRYFAIDVSKLLHVNQPAESTASPSDPWKDCQSFDTDKRLKGCTVVIDAGGYGSRAKLADALDGRCWAYIDQQQYARAVADCKAAIDANPSYAWAYANLGIAYRRLNDFPKALSALDSALKLKVNAIWPWLNRAEILEASGKADDALRDYQFALLIDPSNKQAIDGVVRLRGGSSPGPIDACFDDKALANLGGQATDQSSGQPVPASPSSFDDLEHAILALSDLQTKLRDKSNHYNELFTKAKEQAAKRHEQLTSGLPESRREIDEVQKTIEISSMAQVRADELSAKIVEEKKQLEARQKTHPSPQALRKLGVTLDKLTAAKQEAGRDAQQKAARLVSAKGTMESKAAEYATHLIEIHNLDLDAERASKCGTDTVSVTKQLGSKLAELQDQLRNAQVKNEIELSKTLFEDITKFANDNPTVIPLDAAPFVTQLKDAMRGTDPGNISDTREKLQSRLNNVPQFREFVAGRDRERIKKAAMELARAKNHVRTISDFLQWYVRSNITSDAVSLLLTLNEELARALLTPRTERLPS
jgi:tetratricopeptide (TPR) repeat protein